MNHWNFYSMHAKNAQQHCFNGDESERGCFELNSMPMSNFVFEQEPSSQAQTEGLHEGNSNFEKLLAHSIESIKLNHDNFETSCKNIEGHIRTIMEHLNEESCSEEMVEQKEENGVECEKLLAHSIEYIKVNHDNFEASCKNIEAHIKTIIEHLKEESCSEELVEQKEEKSVECENECGHLEVVEEKQKDFIVVEQEKFKNSDKGEKPRLRYEKNHVTIEIQPLVIEEKSPPQNELQFFQKRGNPYPKCLLVGAWEHLIPYAKYMGFLTKRRKRKDDIFFLSYYPP